MFTTFSLISHHTKSKYINLLRTITSTKQINVDIEMKKLNDRKEFVKALDLFDKHKQQTILTDRILVQAFKACTQLGYLERGQVIHKNLSNSSLKNSYIQTTLINFYMQCGRVNDAQCVFDSSVNKTLIHYGSMMKGLIKNKRAEKAIEFFSKIFNPDEILLCLLFNSCAQVQTKQALDFGKKVWSQMSSIHHRDKYILTSAFDMFVKCGDLENAENVFAKKKRIVIDYGQMMKCYNEHSMPMKTIDLYDKMKIEGIQADSIIFLLLIDACGQLGIESRCRSIVKQIPSAMLNDFKLKNALVHMWVSNIQKCKTLVFIYLAFIFETKGKAGCVNEARLVFEQIDQPNHVTYAAMINAYGLNGMHHNAIELFSKISNPDEILLCLIFNCCAQIQTKQALDFGRKFSSQMSLIHYQNESVLTSAFDMFVKCDDLANAKSVFAKKKRTVIDYGQMMKYYNDHSMPLKTINLYDKMKDEGIQANSIIFLLLIDACGQLGIESRCRSIVKHIPSTMLNDFKLKNALIHMWVSNIQKCKTLVFIYLAFIFETKGKAGCVNEARQVFEQIDQPDSVTYNSMINSYGLNGMGHSAVELYHRMPLKMIEEKTYTCVLNACSHSGLVDEARTIFSTIEIKNKWIYTSMIDCLSRLFLFDEAKQLIEEYERHQSPCLPMYTSLLSGARNRNDASLARQTIHRIRELFHNVDESLVPVSILFTNTLASTGELEEASQIRWNMSQSGARKQIGLAWTEYNGEIVQFHVQDRSHPRTSELYDELDRLEKELIEHGHKFDASWITRPLMADETVQSVLNSHSERLALAFNFIQRPVPSRIQIVKNLRICGDCHGAIKLISKIRRCEIIVRDANRIHHFADGKCSCNDHF
ncbi:hypothetical protein I4U23_027000 [Adineta vaga]|nr:hypothetical protein I4U23_027000 [Adineta vaga]